MTESRQRGRWQRASRRRQKCRRCSPEKWASPDHRSVPGGRGRSRAESVGEDSCPGPLAGRCHGIGPGDQQSVRRAERSTQMQVKRRRRRARRKVRTCFRAASRALSATRVASVCAPCRCLASSGCWGGEWPGPAERPAPGSGPSVNAQASASPRGGQPSRSPRKAGRQLLSATAADRRAQTPVRRNARLALSAPKNEGRTSRQLLHPNCRGGGSGQNLTASPRWVTISIPSGAGCFVNTGTCSENRVRPRK